MAEVNVTLKIMPESPNTNLDAIYEEADAKVKEFGGEIGKKEEQEVAFVLKSLIIMFVMDESLGSTETLENQIKEINGVQSVEVTDVRRAIG